MRSAFLAALLALACAQAQATLATGDFLNVPVDVRSLGMGDASQAVAAGADEIAVNPAAIGAVRAEQFYFNHSFLFAGVGADYLTYGVTLGKNHFGASYYHIGYGELQGYDANGNATTNFGPTDTVYGLTYGTKVGAVDVGGTFKYIDSRIVSDATTPTFDLGAHYRLNDEWAFGLTGSNLGGGLKYDAVSSPLPARVSAGVGWRATQGLWMDLDVINPLYSPSYVALGAEYALPVAGVGVMCLRAGVNTENPELGAVAGIKAGFGLKLHALDVDYAIDTGGDLGLAHHLGVGFRFGGAPAQDQQDQ